MMLSREATAALNDYLDQVRAALPLAPSHGLSLVDKLYRQITSACESKARLAHESQVSGEAMQAHLMTLGSPQEWAERLALAEADRLAREVGRVEYRHVRRAQNEEADRLVNEALDAVA